MHANAFSFSAFQASFSSQRYHATSNDSSAGAPQNSGSVADDSVVEGPAVNVAPIDSAAGTTTSDGGNGDSNQSSGQHASFASRVSFSFSSMSVGGLSGKVFEYEMNHALQNRIGNVLDGAGAAVHSRRGGQSNQYELPGGPSTEFGRHHHRHDANSHASPGGRSLGGGFTGGLVGGSIDGSSERHAGITAAMDRIMSAISAHLARVVAEATGGESSAVAAGDEINQAITEGVQSTQESLGQLGVEGEGEAVAAAGEALLSEVAAQVADATTANETATPTNVGGATTTVAAESFRYQFESAEESMRVKVKSLSQAGPVSSRFSSISRGFDLMVETLDGDKVKVSFDQDFLKFKDRSADALVSGRYSSSDFQIRVEGDLDEGELAALNSLFDSVSSLAQTFFQGDVEEAFNFAMSMGMDESELAGFSLNLYEQKVSSSIQAYDGVAALGARGAEKGGVMDGQQAMRGLGDFVKHLKETLDSEAAAQFKNVHQMLADMLSKQVDDMGRDFGHKNRADKIGSSIVAGAEKHHNDSTRSDKAHKGGIHKDSAHRGGIDSIDRASIDRDSTRSIANILERIMTGLAHSEAHRHRHAA